MPPLPRIGQGIKGGAGALPGMGDNQLFQPNLGKGVAKVAPRPNTQPLLPLSLPPEAPGLSQGPLTQIGQQQIADATTQAENRAMNALSHPATIPHLDDAAKQVINNPTPRMAVAMHAMGINPAKLPHLVTHDELKQAVDNIDFKSGNTKVGGKTVTPQDLAISGFQPHVSKAQQIISGIGEGLIGIGPGLVKMFGEDIPVSAYNTFVHHAAQQKDPSMDPAGQDVAKMLGNLWESVRHPVRQWQQDPASLVMNAFTAASAGSGGVARFAELPRAGELADAANISTPRQIARTLIRPQRQTRTISAQFGDAEKPITMHPPAYKSALGGYSQRILDAFLSRALSKPPSDLTPQFVRDLVSGGSMSAPARLGRKLRYDFETDIRGRAGALQAVVPEKLAGNLARGTAARDLHNMLYDAGASSDYVATRPDMKWAGIKPRNVDEPTLAPEFITAKHLKDHPSLSIGSDNALSDHFKPGSKMVATKDQIEADTGPDGSHVIRYVPQDLVDSLKTYHYDASGKVLNNIDRATQVVRSGRFMTPAYFQWAIQNGLLHAAQAGIHLPRNIYQLRTEWPKLSPQVQGAIDGWLGKGIARSTEGGQAAAESWLGQKTQGAREFWHKVDDQWARRLSAIHELNREGYHSAKDWTKLYNKNRGEMQNIVGRTGSKEAISYSEMTPAERASLQKVMTAYGWTRGATTYAGRFPLQHPIQATVGMKASQEVGQPAIKKWYDELGGMVPGYLKEDLPVGGKWLMPTSMFSPTGTGGNLLFEIPGLTGSSTESLASEESPALAALTGFVEGRDQYGKQYVGNQRFTEPIKGFAHAFKPYSALETLIGGKKGGTYVQGPEQAALQLSGAPLKELKDPKKTASLGEKDFEQSLSPTDRIRFQYSRKLEQLPKELAMYQKAAGQPLDHMSLSRLKGDFDNVEQRDMFQYQYANAHGAKTWKALPPLNKFAGTVDWMAHHGYNHASLAALQHQVTTQATDDKQVEAIVNKMWQATGIGQYESKWKSTVKGLQPPALTHANG